MVAEEYREEAEEAPMEDERALEDFEELHDDDDNEEVELEGQDEEDDDDDDEDEDGGGGFFFLSRNVFKMPSIFPGSIQLLLQVYEARKLQKEQ